MEGLMVLSAVVFWLVGIVMNAKIADKKNIGTTGIALASVFLGPILPYMYLLAVPSNPEK